MTRGILILVNRPREGVPHAESDASVLEAAAAVAQALACLGVPCRMAAASSLKEAGQAIASAPETCVVNLVECFGADTESACLAPALCEGLGKGYTGNGAICQLLALDKGLARGVMQCGGVAVPEGAILGPGTTHVPEPLLTGPVIVKPLRSDASEGIDAAAVLASPTPKAILDRAGRIHAAMGQLALVERFVDGREFNISLLKHGDAIRVLPLAEIDLSALTGDRPRIVDYRAKWIKTSFEYTHTPRLIPADVEPGLARRLRDAALGAWRCLGCRDYARVDMRVDRAGQPLVIDVNPNPDISPEGGFACALTAAGLSYSDFVRILLENAGFALASRSRRAPTAMGDSVLRLRRSEPGDREPILALLAATGVFRADELDVAREVLDDALAAGAAGHYQSLTALRNGTVCGWTCFGETPCTLGTYDLYWIAVDPAAERQGVGRALMTAAERAIWEQGGRLVMVETSSREAYAPARRFYESSGYAKVGTVPDCYSAGDDKVIFTKGCPD